MRGLMPASIWARFHAQTRHCSSSSAETPTQEYQRLLAEQEQIHGRQEIFTAAAQVRCQEAKFRLSALVSELDALELRVSSQY